MDLRGIDGKDGRLKKLTQDCVQWQALVIAVSNFGFYYHRVRFLYFISK
jgi:hypothetical protein